MPEPLLVHSPLKHILQENPQLADRRLKEGALISYKGRKYGWLSVKDNGIRLSAALLHTLELTAGDALLCIRSSNIAFTMGVKGSYTFDSRKNHQILRIAECPHFCKAKPEKVHTIHDVCRKANSTAFLANAICIG